MVGSGEDAQIAVFLSNGETLQATSDNPSFRAICQAAIDGDEDIAKLFDTAEVVARSFKSLSGRVSTDGGKVYLDGDELHGTLVQHILESIAVGADETPLVNFLENMALNPNPKAVAQVYDWLQASEGFTLDPEGYIRGYKGVCAQEPDGSFLSIHSGRARVNGVEVVGQIPNRVGDVIEMPRSQVQDDPSRGCSTGLHVGTFDYANGFARGNLLEVRVNPRDIVSVPTECSAQKMRVCRYEVVGTIAQKYATPVVGFSKSVDDLWGDGEGLGDESDLWFDFLND
jgi:hypothetical protein